MRTLGNKAKKIYNPKRFGFIFLSIMYVDLEDKKNDNTEEVCSFHLPR